MPLLTDLISQSRTRKTVRHTVLCRPFPRSTTSSGAERVGEGDVRTVCEGRGSGGWDAVGVSVLRGWLVLRWYVPSCVLSCLRSCVRFVVCSRAYCPGLRFCHYIRYNKSASFLLFSPWLDLRLAGSRYNTPARRAVPAQVLR